MNQAKRTARKRYIRQEVNRVKLEDDSLEKRVGFLTKCRHLASKTFQKEIDFALAVCANQQPYRILPKFIKLLNKFVTAKLVNVEDCRQGVCIEVQPDHIKVEGITGQVFKCERDATIVPLKNLWGESKDFAVSKGVTE